MSDTEKKVSHTRDKTIHEIVERARREYPYLERPLLRKLIKAEHKDFQPHNGKERTLDRALKKSFEREPYALLYASPGAMHETLKILDDNPELWEFADIFHFHLMIGSSVEEAKKQALKALHAHKLIREGLAAADGTEKHYSKQEIAEITKEAEERLQSSDPDFLKRWNKK